MNTDTASPCPEAPGFVLASPPFSPLGWSVWRRLGVAVGACALLWAVTLWAMD